MWSRPTSCESERSTGDLTGAIEQAPPLADPGFIDYLESYSETHLPEDLARACVRRLTDLRRILFNPQQAAFDALMGGLLGRRIASG
jgi:hypothetical protein